MEGTSECYIVGSIPPSSKRLRLNSDVCNQEIIPLDIFGKIGRHLDIHSLWNLESASKTLCLGIRDNKSLWEFFGSTFGIPNNISDRQHVKIQVFLIKKVCQNIFNNVESIRININLKNIIKSYLNNNDIAALYKICQLRDNIAIYEKSAMLSFTSIQTLGHLWETSQVCSHMFKKVNEKSTYLFLNQKNLSSLPKNIFLSNELEVLEAKNNRLLFLPSQIVKLKKLQHISVRDNYIFTYPVNFCDLTNLKYLDLSHNFLSEFPPHLEKLTKLEHLDVSHNKITSIPDSIQNLCNLQFFYFNNNLITALPLNLKQIVQLQSLWESRNLIFPKGNSQHEFFKKHHPRYYFQNFQLTTLSTATLNLYNLRSHYGNTGRLLFKCSNQIKQIASLSFNFANNKFPLSELGFENENDPRKVRLGVSIKLIDLNIHIYKQT